MTDTRTRRRGTELEQAILDAAWAELSEVGYTALTIEAVAKRAGTSKPVIYRRWPSRAELVIASWATRRPMQEAAPDLGSLRADLLALFNHVATRMDAMMSQTIAGVMAEAFQHPEVQRLLRDRLESAPLTKAIRRIVDNAVRRGELRPVVLPRRVLQLPLGLLRGEAIMCGTPLADEVVASLVDEIYIPLLKGLSAD